MTLAHPDPLDLDQVELVAEIVYRFTFHARHADAGWDRLKVRADEGAGYSGHLVSHCYEAAGAILTALSYHVEREPGHAPHRAV